MSTSIELAAFAAAGVVGGLWLLWRGFVGYREAARIGDTSTSRIATLAIGEVRVSGVVEPAELTLVSPLQSTPCIFYHSSIHQSGDDGGDTLFREERAVGFRVRDATGSVRIFPRGARFDVPLAFDERAGVLGEAPPGLHLRSGAAYGVWVGEPSREAQIAALLSVRRPEPASVGSSESLRLGGSSLAIGAGSRARTFREARIVPGDVVTVVGQVLPFDQLPDPASADLDAGETLASLADPEIAADLAEARAAGELAATPEAAWGNAAIPGFGIGRPVSEPQLDPEARAAPLAPAEEAARSERTFAIGAHDLVLAASGNPRSSSPSGRPARRSPAMSGDSSSGCSAPSWRLPRPWGSPSLSEGCRRDTDGGGRRCSPSGSRSSSSA